MMIIYKVQSAQAGLCHIGLISLKSNQIAGKGTKECHKTGKSTEWNELQRKVGSPQSTYTG